MEWTRIDYNYWLYNTSARDDATLDDLDEDGKIIYSLDL
jgi:hypothetical protein